MLLQSSHLVFSGKTSLIVRDGTRGLRGGAAFEENGINAGLPPADVPPIWRSNTLRFSVVPRRFKSGFGNDGLLGPKIIAMF